MFIINLTELEKELAKYKYLVLERSQKKYLEIRRLFRNKEISQQKLFELVNESIKLSENRKNASNALEHVWGYFKRKCNESEKKTFFDLFRQYNENEIDLVIIKKYLLDLSIKYNEEYLLNSYYFDSIK
ncbi:YbgA family protein [Haploplasma axanthum]|uniref:Uncharacterized conserved protein n=1 Tax=Haploplasma axanthum TaxID=29552 RepID=A0A449BBR2_HAPAX|nr:YbgA family protein [Haploplasma axanthum]VEU79876.1 Uncharacterized conserved protein [Haploplasma axanthum]